MIKQVSPTVRFRYPCRGRRYGLRPDPFVASRHFPYEGNPLDDPRKMRRRKTAMILYALFVNIFKSHSHCCDHKRRKGAFFSLNCFFHRFNNIIWKTNRLICCGRNDRDFKFIHINTSQYICLAYSVFQGVRKICIANAMHICYNADGR